MSPEPDVSSAAQTRMGASAPRAERDLLLTHVLDAFRGDLRRDPAPWSYRIGVVFVAAVMILLPLIYLAIPVLVTWFAQWHSVHNVGMLRHLRGSTQSIFVLGAYLAPMIAAVLLVITLVKPFFARTVNGPAPVTVTPEDQPVLWAFAEKIRLLVGAPPIRQLVLDHDVNASASLGASLTSIFNRKLVLTIGLPLFSGLTTRQLAGVLAHEFGHFAQGGAIRLTHLIRMINFWFVRVVYGRDAWDEGLRSAASRADIRFSWVIWIAIGSVWLTRQILWALMYLGQATSSFLMRAMEFDADTREIHLVGSGTFEATMERVRDLGLTVSAAHQRLALYSRDGKLVDDLGALVTMVEKNLEVEERRSLLELHAARKKSVYDTHPPDEQRIARARRSASAGIFDLDEPAQQLILDYPVVARRVTEWFYVNVAGLALDGAFVLKPATEVVDASERELRAHAALERGYQGSFQAAAVRPWASPLAAAFVSLEDDPASTPRALLEATRVRSITAGATARDAAERAEHALSGLLEAQQAEMLLQSGVDLQKASLPSGLKSATDIEQMRERREEELGVTRRDYETATQPMAERIARARRTLEGEAAAIDAETVATLRASMDRFATVLDALCAELPRIDALELELGGIEVLAQLRQQAQDKITIDELIAPHRQRVREQIDALAISLTDLPYPLEHAVEGLDCVRALIPDADPAHGLFAIFVRADLVVNKYRETVTRCLGALCVATEEVESALGMPLLEVVREEVAFG